MSKRALQFYFWLLFATMLLIAQALRIIYSGTSDPFPLILFGVTAALILIAVVIRTVLL